MSAVCILHFLSVTLLYIEIYANIRPSLSLTLTLCVSLLYSHFGMVNIFAACLHSFTLPCVVLMISSFFFSVVANKERFVLQTTQAIVVGDLFFRRAIATVQKWWK